MCISLAINKFQYTYNVKPLLFFENRAVYEIMWKKYRTVRQATDDKIVRRMRIARFIQGYWHTLRICDTARTGTLTRLLSVKLEPRLVTTDTAGLVLNQAVSRTPRTAKGRLQPQASPCLCCSQWHYDNFIHEYFNPPSPVSTAPPTLHVQSFITDRVV